MQTTIEVAEGKIIIDSPYSEENNKSWRELGGKYSGNWILPDNDTSRARIAELFGAKSEEVDVLIPVDQIPKPNSQIVQIGGYVLVERRGRDYRVRTPDGVSLAAGSFRSFGGSHKKSIGRIRRRRSVPTTLPPLVCRGQRANHCTSDHSE